MPLSFVRNDITKLNVDAIVNAANSVLRRGGGVCGAIFAAAGPDELQAACDEIGHCDTGSSVATPGFALPARYVIHTVGPVWQGGYAGERELLTSCYRTALELAHELECASIAFPLISAGIYGYPPDQALEVATSAIRAYLDEDPDMEVTLCLFDRRALGFVEGILGEVESYIDDAYVDRNPYRRRTPQENAARPYSAGAPAAMPAPQATPSASEIKSFPFPLLNRRAKKSAPEIEEECVRADFAYEAPSREAVSREAVSRDVASLEDLLTHMDASFADTLLNMIDARDLTDAQVYARANLSRQYFSKLRAGSINPSKRVVCALAIALELTLDETKLLLERAGHALTHASKFDIVIEWFINRGNYDIFLINKTLFALDLPLLGAR